MTELWQIMEQCWSEDPAQRLSSAEVVERLGALSNTPEDNRPPNELNSHSVSQLVYRQTNHPFSPLFQNTEADKEEKEYSLEMVQTDSLDGHDPAEGRTS